MSQLFGMSSYKLPLEVEDWEMSPDMPRAARQTNDSDYRRADDQQDLLKHGFSLFACNQIIGDNEEHTQSNAAIELSKFYICQT